jgi:hypothetical protein
MSTDRWLVFTDRLVIREDRIASITPGAGCVFVTERGSRGMTHTVLGATMDDVARLLLRTSRSVDLAKPS